MQETSLGRREVLTGVAAGSASAVAGCGNLIRNPSGTLEKALFNVETVSESETADIRFALEFNRGASEISASDVLDVSRGNVTEDVDSVNWFNKCASADYQSEFPGEDLSNYETTDQFDSNISVDLDNSITGRIKDAVDLAAVNYSAERASIPSIEYTGGSLVNDDQFVRLQLHDGMMYSFPRTNVPMPITGRYDINQSNLTAQSVDGNSLSFDSNVPDVNPDQGRKTLVPAFEHRAQPLVPTLRTLAQRRHALLDFTVRIIPYTGAQNPEDVGRQAASPFFELANDAVGMIGPGDPDSPNKLALSYGMQFAPMILGAGLGPVGFAIGAGISTTYTIFATVEGLNDYADTNIGNFDTPESIWEFDPEEDSAQDFAGGFNAGNLAPLYREGGTQFTGDDTSSVWAVNALTSFQQQYGAEALATSSSVIREIEKYRRTLDEIETQITELRDVVEYHEGSLVQAFSSNHYNCINNGFGYALDVVALERDLLDDLETIVSDTSEILVETWTDDSLSAANRPTWVDETSNRIDADIETGEDHLKLEGTGVGNGTVSTPINYTGLNSVWTLTGSFTVESLIGQVRHDISVTDGSSDKIRLPLIWADTTTDGGTTRSESVESHEFTFDIVGSDIDTGEGDSATIEIGTNYEYELSHDGNGSYSASIGPADGSGNTASVSGNGEVLSSGSYGFEYEVLSSDDFVVTHDRIEYRLDEDD